MTASAPPRRSARFAQAVARRAGGAALATACFGAQAHEAGPLDASLPWAGWGGPWWLGLAWALGGALALRGIAALWRRAGRPAGVRPGQAACLVAGWLVLGAALFSPLDALGQSLFWAHMAQHELLMLVAAPLLVLGRPIGALVWGLPPRWRAPAAALAATLGLPAAMRVLTRPFTAWALHAAVLWGWHAPPLFEAALARSWVHDLQHASFLVSALAFWWALLPAGGARVRQGLGVCYLFTTLVHTSVLGALLTFSGRAWYGAYAASAPHWGLSALEDQQLGGLIMWVPGGVVYLAAGLALFAAWLGRDTPSLAAAPGAVR